MAACCSNYTTKHTNSVWAKYRALKSYSTGSSYYMAV